MNLNSPKVIVITATIGTKYLQNCIDSVQKQTYSNVSHLIVCDGNNYINDVCNIINNTVDKTKSIELMVIPWNSGANKYICHKIYASIPHLIHEPCYICFLDEDNYYEPEHIETLINTIKDNDCTWAYCLRNIVKPNGEFICRDLCESLGKLYRTWNSIDGFPGYLVDTSCYMVPVEILRQFSECWQRPARSHPEADRCFYENISKKYKRFECSMKFTLNYRVEGRSDSVKPDFFLMGNGVLKRHLKLNTLPWDKE